MRSCSTACNASICWLSLEGSCQGLDAHSWRKTRHIDGKVAKHLVGGAGEELGDRLAVINAVI
jgi:hypothetical protein